ncbi:MAG: glycine cleavage system aminomethyltransferase GcvT [Candidatus Omnitrophica bacterium]|nr:glycine cleavage system aminomethyltransferase GcvT [Candidatus Omnitrophota bacterium]
MLSEEILKKTPLYDNHIKLQAKMVPFGGWEMPVQYEGILAEYDATRNRVSIFDTSHMGEFMVKGDVSKSGLDKIVTQPLADMPVKTCRYGAMLNDDGGVVDDLIVYRLDDEEWMVVVNGATMSKDEAQFEKHITEQGVFVNHSGHLGKIDIQGPGSRELLSSIVDGIEKLEYYTFNIFNVLGENVVVSRTGYTGELGYEIYYPQEKISALWERLLEKGAAPAGLGVRDLLRIEMGYSLYGHELSEDINPLDAGISRFIDWEKEFVGKAALQEARDAGVSRKIISFVSGSRRSPRSGYQIFSSGADPVGVVTSATFSPVLKCGIGLGFVPKEGYKAGEKILFGTKEKQWAAEVHARPIYKNSSLKS